MSRIEKASNVDRLLEEAHQAHVAIHDTAEAVLKQAMEAGDRLLAARELVPHGEWTAKVEAIGIPARTAQRYMMLGRERDRVLASGAVTVREAVRLIADRVPPRRRQASEGTGRAARRPKEPNDRYAQGYDAGYRAGRADSATAIGKGRGDGAPSQRDLLWLINLAHPDHHQDDPHDVLVATRLTVWLNELRGQR